MIKMMIEYINYKRKIKVYSDEVNKWNNKVKLYNYYGVWNGKKII